MTDENIPGPLIEGLIRAGWDVVRVIEVFGEHSIDARIFDHAVAQGRALVSTDADCLVSATRWLTELPFQLVYWHQGTYQRTPVVRFLKAFEDLAENPNAFTAFIEYLKPTS